MMIFPEPDEWNFYEMFKKDVKKWIGRIEIYFENNTTSHIIVKALALLLSVAGAVADILDVSEKYWPPYATVLLLLVVIVVFVILDTAHVFIAKRRLVALNRTKRLVNNMVKIIRGASNLQLSAYRILNWEVEHDINENGDVRYKRTMTIGYLDGMVYWVRIPIGVIDGLSEDKHEDLGIEVINPDDGGRLPWAVIDESPSRKVLAVMLDPPASPSTTSSLCLSLTWKGAYSPLVTEGQDNGNITIDHETKRLIMRFFAPKGLEFVAIRMKKKLGDEEIVNQEDGRSVLIWEANNLTRGKYPYTLVCKQKEPQ